jgi:GDPmannose 4,6-dehydratase
MLQQEHPEDFVIATGKQISVRKFIELTSKNLGFTLRWEGTGTDEQGIVSSVSSDDSPGVKVGDIIIKIDPRYFRPTEVETLLGDPSKAKQKLGWEPQITMEQMCEEMTQADLKIAKQHSLLKKHGYDINVSIE